MVDIDLIRKRGGTPEALKTKFARESIKPGSKIEELIKISASRVSDGIDSTFRDAKFWWAIDRAHDVNQKQVPYELVQGFFDRNLTEKEDVLSLAKDWGIDNMFSPVVDGGGQPVKSNGAVQYKLDLPTFFQVFVPVVQSYLKIRVAKLFGDRDTYPLYQYAPLRLTMRDRLKTDIITSRIQRQTSDMGYRADERQSILQSLLYGVCLNFPMEAWWTEKQIADGKEKVIREGIRYAIPHPSRTFYDINHRLSTMNSDTGCSWAGYWDIVRWGEVHSTSEYWNLSEVPSDYSRFKWPASKGWRVYQELFPCRFPFPNIDRTSGAGEQDRTQRAYRYTRDDYDYGVTQIALFQKLIPKEWGLYDYKYPVWHRFVFAAEDAVLWCEPLGYPPVIAYTYDHDQNRAFNSSLGLELMPWQGMMSNYLTQLLLSIKQNLANVMFWNEDLLDKDYIKQIKNIGEKLYRHTNFIPFSREKWSWQRGSGPETVFHKVDFPRTNTQEILLAVNTMLNILERMLGYTPEEIGGRSASDESATGVKTRERHSAIRTAFTGGFVDEARHARKGQLYAAMMNYSDDEIFAEVADLNDAKQSELEDLGFEVEQAASGQHTRAGVKGPKSALTVDGFATDRDAGGQIPDQAIAQGMVQTFQVIFSNPKIVEQVGIEQLIDLFNQMLFYTGLPRDFRLRIDKTIPSPSEQMQQLQAQISQALKAVQEQSQAGDQAIAQGMQQEMQKLAQGINEGAIAPIKQALQQLGQKLTEIEGAVQANSAADQQRDQVIQQMAAAVQQTTPVPAGQF